MHSISSEAKIIFIAALRDVPLDRWPSYVETACAENPSLRCRVDALMRAHRNPREYFQRLNTEARHTSWDELDSTHMLGMELGCYRLLHEIGAGGMGVVYEAEQREPFARHVAVKILRSDMSTVDVIDRFVAERQTLALMDHPNIARVLDAGATDRGRPYLVMELVPGIPIADYCDQNCLTVRERLNLFVPVCQAIQHAHQKGIVHLDIKPSNVLVTLHDGIPLPKIIDFGIAKAICQSFTVDNVFAGHTHVIGTPLYMSPEQAECSGMDVDARSDIYSLGVLLYELLTGSTPFDKEWLREAGLDDVRRMIREEEPLRPSTRIGMLAGEAASTIPSRRNTDQSRLSQMLRSELDWIVMKALEKDRSRRYEAASAFARDVQRYLQDEPIEARPSSARYRFFKFARRNRIALLAVVTVGAALLVATGVAAWQAIRATRALRLLGEQSTEVVRQRTLAEANFRLAQDAVDESFLQLQHADLSSLRGELLESYLGYYQEFVTRRADDPKLLTDVALAYGKIGDIKGDLGSDDAVQAYELAMALWGRLAADEPGNPDYESALARTYYQLGEVQRIYGRSDKAIAAYQGAVEIWERLAAEFPKSTQHRANLANACGWLAVMLKRSQEFADAIIVCQKATCHAYQLTVQDPADISYATMLAQWLFELAKLQRLLGEPESAAQSFQEAFDSYQALRNNRLSMDRDPHALAEVNHALSELCLWDHRLDEAVHYGRNAVNIRERLTSLDAINGVVLAESYSLLGTVHCATRQFNEALDAHYKAAAIRELLVAGNPECIFEGVLAESYQAIGDLHARMGNLEEAMDAFKKAVVRQQAFAVKDASARHHPIILSKSLDALGMVQVQLGHLDDAVTSFQRVLEIRERIPKELRNAEDWGYVGRALFRIGRWEEAREALEKSIVMCGDDGPTLQGGYRWWYLTMTLARLGESQTAYEYFEQLAAETDGQQTLHPFHLCLRTEAAQTLRIDDSSNKKEVHQ